MLPRNERQAAAIRQMWPAIFGTRKAIIPEQVVDGLNLIWYSDLVISGGGTMNREAAALGVPVYSTFRGKIGAVDHYLVEQGRLVLLETADDLYTKLRLQRRPCPERPRSGEHTTLNAVTNNIIYLAELESQK